MPVRLRELTQKQDELAGKVAVQTQPPRIDIKTAMAYRRKLETLFKHGSPADKKRLLRTWVEEIRLAPERLEVEITYRVPEPVMNSVVAGAGFGTDSPDSWEWEDVAPNDVVGVG